MIWLGKIDQNQNFWFFTQNRGRLGVLDEWVTKLSRIFLSRTLLSGHYSPAENFPGTKLSRDKYLQGQYSPAEIENSPGTLLSRDKILRDIILPRTKLSGYKTLQVQNSPGTNFSQHKIALGQNSPFSKQMHIGNWEFLHWYKTLPFAILPLFT